MSAKTTSKSASSKLFGWLLGAGRPVLIISAVVGVLVAGLYLVWRRVGERVLASPEYSVGPEQVEITPPPPWIHSDIRAEVFGDPTLDGPLSLLEDDLVERIKKAFEARPWVSKVTHVSKSHPAAVKVELAYRKPVCMVEASGGLFAVDVEGVILPSEDFSPVEAGRYPRLLGMDRGPTVPPGRRWGDARVVGAAEIAAAIGEAWETMRLKFISTEQPGAAAAEGASNLRAVEPIFVLTTSSGSRITWGYAPGVNMPGELAPAEKVARLHRYYLEHDSLDGPEGKPHQLDVRQLRSTAPQ